LENPRTPHPPSDFRTWVQTKNMTTLDRWIRLPYQTPKRPAVSWPHRQFPPVSVKRLDASWSDLHGIVGCPLIIKTKMTMCHWYGYDRRLCLLQYVDIIAFVTCSGIPV
jgi:hypothetical protein